MKKTKYGKSNNKTIYVSESRAKEWQNLVDYAETHNIGIGELLMDAWKKQNNKSEDLRKKYNI